jgi:hypothetical protein
MCDNADEPGAWIKHLTADSSLGNAAAKATAVAVTTALVA